MPFDEKFDDIYQLGIKESCEKVNAYCERVDEQIYHETILERVYNQIAKADVIIADMTGRNPNVFYEVGYAHALDKRTILLTQNADDIPLDLKHFPHIVYEGKISLLRKELIRRTRWFIGHPPDEAASGQIAIDLYLAEENLSSGRTVYECRDNRPHLEITVHNASSTTFDSGDLKIGIVASSRLAYTSSNAEMVPSRIPDGNILHMLRAFPLLLPNAYLSFVSEFAAGDRGGEEMITFRVFTRAGSRDYPLTVRWAAPGKPKVRKINVRGNKRTD